MKVCTKCGEEKENTEYHKQRNGVQGLRCHCKSCRSMKGLSDRDRYVKYLYRQYDKYGITEGGARYLMDKQRGCCPVCRETLGGIEGEWYHVDHSHVTGKVRGLLCSNCNTGMGMLKDSAEVCMRAATYLMCYE